MKRLRDIFLIIMVLSLLLSAEDFNTTGTTGFVFLNLPVSARFTAMGETGITLNDVGADGLFINPGLIARGKSRTSITATHGQWYGDSKHQTLGFSHNFGNFGSVGIMFNYFDFGDIQKTRALFPDEVGNLSEGDNNLYYDLGTYNAGAYALGVAYSRYLTLNFTFGTTMKYVRESIDSYYADNLLLDLGFVYNTGIGSMRIGTFLKNFGLETEYEYEQFKMPQRLVLGISGEIFGDLNAKNYTSLHFEAVHPNDAAEHIHLGIESKLMNILYLRGGYKFGYDHENLSVGMGTEFVYRARHLRLDISYMNHEYLEETIRYSLSMEL